MKKQLTILLALLAASLLVGSAQAHANLERSEPAAGETLASAPPEMVMEFSEDLDARFTRVQLLDSDNQVVVAGPGEIDPASPNVWRLALGDLPQGSYLAVWRARSTVDGHVTNGIVPFGIGVPPATGSLIPPPDAPDPLTESPLPLDSTARWFNLLGVVIALGSLPFAVFGWRSDNESMAVQLRILTLLGVIALTLASAFFLLVQAASAVSLPLVQAIGEPLRLMLSSYSGWLVLARVGSAYAVLILIWRLPMKDWWIALFPGGICLLTFSLYAHGAAESDGAVVAVVADLLHIAATVSWLGGLIPLFIAIRAAGRNPDNATPLAILIPRFSSLAIVCVATLALTGLYSYFLHINQLDLLSITTYGRALIIKSALFALLFLLGAVNLLILSPHLRARGNELAHAFSRTVRTELLVGGLLLLAVGAMTSVAPSQIAWEAYQLTQKDISRKSATINEVGLVLSIAPARVGSNEFVVDVADLRPGAENVPASVLLRLSNIEQNTNQLQLETRTTDGLRYTVSGNYISLTGEWEIEIIVRRSGFNDVRVEFELDFGPL